MRTGVSIFSISFLLIFSVLHVEPLFHGRIVKNEQTASKTKKPTCSKAKKPVCTKSKCPKKQSPKENNDCPNTGCNPFVPCAMGSCCYLVETAFSYSNSTTISKQKIALINDNRLLNNLSECWHPPEV